MQSTASANEGTMENDTSDGLTEVTHQSLFKFGQERMWNSTTTWNIACPDNLSEPHH